MTLNSADKPLIAKLKSALPEIAVKAVDPKYLEEPRGRFHGKAGAVVLPKSTAEVSALVKFAANVRIGIVPYGGGTGLVGGQVLENGAVPLVVSLERMNSVRAVSAQEQTITVDAGVILQDVQVAATGPGLLFPLSLASQGSCQIGGNLATNAGGLNVIRYGNARNLCLGIEAVLPNGDVFNGLSRVKKDNTGFDLRDLLIGSEGSLGIITGACLQLFPKPAKDGTAMLVVKDPDAALQVLSLARAAVGEAVSAFELINGQGLDFLAETMPQIRQPFDDIPEWSVLIDLGLPQYADPQNVLTSLFEAAVAKGLVSDGVVAQNEQQRSGLWTIRESIPAANKQIGAVTSTDISVPASAMLQFVTQGAVAIRELGPFRINCFGHLGDGNLHFNVFPPKGKGKSEYLDQSEMLRQTIHELVTKFEGSISAEHGIGRLKVGDLERFGDPAKLAAMRSIKGALDPLGIMNPGAVLAP